MQAVGFDLLPQLLRLLPPRVHWNDLRHSVCLIPRLLSFMAIVEVVVAAAAAAL